MKPKIFKYTLREVDFFYSVDFGIEGTREFMKEAFQDPHIKLGKEYFKDEIERTLDNFLPPKFKELVDLNSRENKLERIAILEAHGDEKNKKWCYDDGENLFSVQSWINKMDGKYKLLILAVCNKEGHNISSKKSLVCFPNEVYSVRGREHGEVQIELFIPGLRYIDSYTIDDDIKKLRKLFR